MPDFLRRLKQRPEVAEAVLISTCNRVELIAAGPPGVEPADVWYVGDARWDMQAAVAAGMLPVAVLTGATGPDELRAAGAAVVVATLGELLELLRDARPAP